jgi:hypothetical protein
VNRHFKGKKEEEENRGSRKVKEVKNYQELVYINMMKPAMSTSLKWQKLEFYSHKD